VAVQLRRLDHFDLHGGVGIAVAFAADRPSVHVLGRMAQGWYFADFVKVFFRQVGMDVDDFGGVAHGGLLLLPERRIFPA